MMNEFLFFLHILFVLMTLFAFLRKGKEALSFVIILQIILANIFVMKQIDLFGFHVTCSDVYAVGTLLGLNLMQEHFGKEEAKKVIGLSFFLLLFFVMMSGLHLLYKPNHFDQTHEAFVSIFSTTPRIVLASIGVFYIVQCFDVWFFGIWKKKNNPLFIRMGGSLFVSQFLDTVLFTFFGLYGVVGSCFDVICMSYMIKEIVILSTTFLVGIGTRIFAIKDEF